MELTFSADQRALRTAVREYLRRGLGEAGGGAAGPEPDPADVAGLRAAWDTLVRDGWTGLGAAQADGSPGGSLTDQLAVQLEFGRALLVAPVAEAEVAAALLGELGGSRADPDRLVLPVLSDGDLAGAFTAVRTAAGLAADGEQMLVPYATLADQLIVPVLIDDASALAVVLVDPRAEGVTVEPHSTIANIPLAAVRLTGVSVTSGQVLSEGDQAAAALRRALARAALLRGAQLTGSGQRLLELSVRYATERHQFGQPVGRFQAVQYLCTDIVIATHEALLLLLTAAAVFDAGDDPSRPVALARAYLRDAAHRIALAAHEVHAGFGFMMESEIQRHSRRLKYLETTMCGPAVTFAVLGLAADSAS